MQSEIDQPKINQRRQRTGAWVSGVLAVAAIALMVVVGYPVGTREPLSLWTLSIIAIAVLVGVLMLGTEVYRRYYSDVNDRETTASGAMISTTAIAAAAAILLLFFLIRYG